MISPVLDNKMQPILEDILLLQSLFEGLPDGVMILSVQKALIYANGLAQQICQKLSADACLNTIPQSIWRGCRALIDSRSRFPDHALILEEDLSLDDHQAIRMRIRWLDQDDAETQPARIVVTLEDLHETAYHRAMAESRRFHLTQRETEVWLLRQDGFSYKAIATQLFISEDTVKKHLKRIHAKRNEQSS